MRMQKAKTTRFKAVGLAFLHYGSGLFLYFLLISSLFLLNHIYLLCFQDKRKGVFKQVYEDEVMKTGLEWLGGIMMT